MSFENVLISVYVIIGIVGFGLGYLFRSLGIFVKRTKGEGK